jgi:predicted acetyltransferase
MLEIYREYVKGKTGFVARGESYVKMLAKTHEIASRECIITEKGYVVFKKDKKLVRIRELVAYDKKEMNKLIRIVEDKAQNVVYGRDVLDHSA